MKNLLRAASGLIPALAVLSFAAGVAAQQQVTNPNLKDAQNAAANAPDLQIFNITRVKDKNELKINVVNAGKTAADNTKITVYALAYGYFITPEKQWQSFLQKADSTFGSADPVKSLAEVSFKLDAYSADKYLKLAWAKINLETNIPAGKMQKLTVKFPAQYNAPAGITPKTVFPLDCIKNSSGHCLFAPTAILTFDLSVFMAYVEHEQELNTKLNNKYFFSQRERK